MTNTENQELIRRLRDALVVAVDALEESNGNADSETLKWLQSQVNELVVVPFINSAR